ncbi:hypothetical protein Tco_0277806 [Tanacetum coccineum]
MEDPVSTSTSSETPSAPAVASQEEPPVNKRRRKRDQSAVEGNAPPKVLRKDHASVHPAQDTRRGKSLAAIRSSKIAAVVADSDSENTSFASMAGSPRVGRNQRLSPGNPRSVPGPGGSHSTAKEAKLLKKSVAQVARRDQRIQARENEIKNLEALLEAEADMKKATEAKNAEIVKELESLRAQFTDLQVSNDRLS